MESYCQRLYILLYILYIDFINPFFNEVSPDWNDVHLYCIGVLAEEVVEIWKPWHLKSKVPAWLLKTTNTLNNIVFVKSWLLRL